MIPQRLNCFIFLGQLWKSQGTSLKNKDDVWESNDAWNFLSEGTKVYIENTSNRSRVATAEEGETNVSYHTNEIGGGIKIEDAGQPKILVPLVLGVEDHSVELVENRKDQLWEIGVENDEGYFTLTHWKTKKVLTAISSNQLEVKGNSWKIKISQNWMYDTVKLRAVDRLSLLFNFRLFGPKVTVHKHQISPS